jgi:serine/threonine-protein kinase RsbT
MAADEGVRRAPDPSPGVSGGQHRLVIAIDGQDDYVVVSARGAARELAREMGFGVVDQTRIAAAVSEIVRNAVLYAGHGTVTFVVHDVPSSLGREARRGIEVVVADQGPGIGDVERVLAGGYSTSGGFGRGIAGSRALMDEFELESRPGRGTTVRMRKWLA